MKSQLRNGIIFVVIAVALVVGYLMFFKKSPEEANIVPSTNTIFPTGEFNQTTTNNGSFFEEDLISLLLSVEGIDLNDAIFSNNAFRTLRDSSITLNEPTDFGRVNPFAPIGSDPIPAFTEPDLGSGESQGATDPSGSSPDSSSLDAGLDDLLSDADLGDLDDLLNL